MSETGGSRTAGSPTRTSGRVEPSRTGGTGPWRPPSSGAGSNSQMYLFIFLAAIVLLLLVGVSMIARAMIHRRRFQRQVQLAIARGETVPQYQNPFHGRTTVRKRSKPLPPMPVMWVSQMRRVDEQEMVEKDEEEWLNPVSMTSVLPYEPPKAPPPPEVPTAPPLRQELSDAVADMFPRLHRRRRMEAQRVPPPRPEPAVEMRAPTIAQAPEQGTDVRIGVLIAMPCEGQQLAMWTPVDPVDAEVPEVAVGVMECTVANAQQEGVR